MVPQEVEVSLEEMVVLELEEPLEPVDYLAVMVLQANVVKQAPLGLRVIAVSLVPEAKLELEDPLDLLALLDLRGLMDLLDVLAPKAVLVAMEETVPLVSLVLPDAMVSVPVVPLDPPEPLERPSRSDPQRRGSSPLNPTSVSWSARPVCLGVRLRRSARLTDL